MENKNRKSSPLANLLGGVLAGAMAGGCLLVVVVALIALIKLGVWLWTL